MLVEMRARGGARKQSHHRDRGLRPRSEVDEIYLDEDYYIAPIDKVGTEAFAVIRGP